MEKTIAQFLNVKEFPFFIKDDSGNVIYRENKDGFWRKANFNNQNKEIYFENSLGTWVKREYDQNGFQIYFENHTGFWEKTEYNQSGGIIYFETVDRIIKDNRPKPKPQPGTLDIENLLDWLNMEENSVILAFYKKHGNGH